MNVRDKLVANNRLREVEIGIFIVARRVQKSDKFDVVVSDGYGLGGEPIYLQQIKDLNTTIAEEDAVFIITHESWGRMLTNNLLLKNEDE